MSLRKSILLSTLIIITSHNAYAQDMSGWSDKTVCRLASAQSDNSTFLAEAASRGIDCNAPARTSNNSSIKTNKGLSLQAVKKALYEDDIGKLQFLEPHPLISPVAKAPVQSSNYSIMNEHSLHFQLHHGECGEEPKWSDCDNNRERTELTFRKEIPKKEKWYRFLINIPKSHNQLAPAKLSLIQWKRYSKPSRTMIMFQHTAAGLVFNRNGDTFRDSYIVLVSEEDLYERWIEIVFNTNWHPNKDKGYMKVWVDGELKIDFAGVSHASTAEKLSLRFGLYSSFLHQYAGKEFPKREIYFDGIRSETSCKKLLKDEGKCSQMTSQQVTEYIAHMYSAYSSKISKSSLRPIKAEDYR